MTTLTILQTTLIRVAVFNEQDWERSAEDVFQALGEQIPDTIEHEDILTAVAQYMDISDAQLVEAVYGNERRGQLIVSASAQTGNISIRPETVLGINCLLTNHDYSI